MLALRNEIALRLGYKSWDDYQTEVKMAKTGMNAEKYINDLVAGIQPKFDSEVAELQKLKAAEPMILTPKSWCGTGGTTATSGTSKNTPSIRKRCARISRSKKSSTGCSTFIRASSV
jgi:Zn-dependent oligopeptidases